MQKEENEKCITIIISIFLGFLGWLVKSVLDSLLLYDKPFIEVVITDVPTSEIYIRVFVSICFSIFGFILSNNYYETKKAYESLRMLNENLETKVKDRTKKISDLLDEKNQLIINLGHDLRTPLTPLMALIPNIIKKEKDEELKKLLKISLENIHYLRDKVNETIEIAKYDSNLIKLNIQKTNLLNQIERVIEYNKFFLKKNNIFIENKVDENINIHADVIRIREVFDRLLKNSAKYTKKENKIIEFGAKNKDHFIEIYIKDNGDGLTKEQINHIFDEFYKTDKSRHDLNENGLGLSISKRIVEKHKGEIWAESKGADEGTTIFIKLPKL